MCYDKLPRHGKRSLCLRCVRCFYSKVRFIDINGNLYWMSLAFIFANLLFMSMTQPLMMVATGVKMVTSIAMSLNPSSMAA